MQIDRDYYRRKIIDLTGVQDVNDKAIRKFQFYIDRANRLKEVRYAPFFREDEGRVVLEKLSELWALVEGFMDQEAACNTYGRFLPSYVQLMRSCEFVPEQVHHALLVGAISAPTVREYCKVVRDVLPKADCTVIDLKGVETVKASQGLCNFLFADALELPFNGYFDSIHTNFLLGKLVSSDSLPSRQLRLKFYASASNALRAGGTLLMVEPAWDLSDSAGDLEADLTGMGFADLTIRPAVGFRRRRFVDQCLGDIPLLVQDEQTETLEGRFGVLAVSAVKR